MSQVHHLDWTLSSSSSWSFMWVQDRRSLTITTFLDIARVSTLHNLLFSFVLRKQEKSFITCSIRNRSWNGMRISTRSIETQVDRYDVTSSQRCKNQLRRPVFWYFLPVGIHKPVRPCFTFGEGIWRIGTKTQLCTGHFECQSSRRVIYVEPQSLYSREKEGWHLLKSPHVAICKKGMNASGGLKY